MAGKTSANKNFASPIPDYASLHPGYGLQATYRAVAARRNGDGAAFNSNSVVFSITA
jgi:hypothetical protein